MIEDLPDDSSEPLDEGNELPDRSSEERPTRGLLWILVPAGLGLLIGATYQAWALIGNYEGLFPISVASGAAIGGGIGLAVGAFIWTFFPYKSRARNDHHDE